ncbi:MAG: hypothetical protein EGP63_06275, partial [Bacteroides stercoris]|nr:hypothetical protein [Bacteroides stercoris]
HGKMAIRMTYEVVMPYHLHMPSYFLGTFTEYPYISLSSPNNSFIFNALKHKVTSDDKKRKNLV